MKSHSLTWLWPKKLECCCEERLQLRADRVRSHPLLSINYFCFECSILPITIRDSNTPLTSSSTKYDPMQITGDPYLHLLPRIYNKKLGCTFLLDCLNIALGKKEDGFVTSGYYGIPPLNKNVSLLPLSLLGQSAAWRSAIMCRIIVGSNLNPV